MYILCFRKVYNLVGATTDVHIGYSRSNPEKRWERMDSNPMGNFSFEWTEYGQMDFEFLTLSCIKDNKFGKVWDLPEEINKSFICQYNQNLVSLIVFEPLCPILLSAKIFFISKNRKTHIVILKIYTLEEKLLVKPKFSGVIILVVTNQFSLL